MKYHLRENEVDEQPFPIHYHHHPCQLVSYRVVAQRTGIQAKLCQDTPPANGNIYILSTHLE